MILPRMCGKRDPSHPLYSRAATRNLTGDFHVVELPVLQPGKLEVQCLSQRLVILFNELTSFTCTKNQPIAENVHQKWGP